MVAGSASPIVSAPPSEIRSNAFFLETGKPWYVPVTVDATVATNRPTEEGA